MSHETEREQLVDALGRTSRVQRESVLDAIRVVPRHEFVPESKEDQAYRDQPLPIGHDQTISAPHMVAIMCDRLALSSGDRVLEIGTGCGYHAAVTAEIVDPSTVYSVEYVPELAETAQERLDRLEYAVRVKNGDGHEGWPEHAPYDAAYLTCAAPEIPDPIVEQVAPGGRIVAPIGRHSQKLVIAEKKDDGSMSRGTDGRVRFVPMRG
jgi:protein-L-isoaspartate(D-aspartate) O-methyltransferase